MTADTFPDRVARITAREKSRIILASKEWERESRETPNQGLGSSALRCWKNGGARKVKRVDLGGKTHERAREKLHGTYTTQNECTSTGGMEGTLAWY